MEWKYGDAWERFPIQEGETWQAGAGLVAVHNLFDPLPGFMRSADVLFMDPPWNVGNLNSFYTKAGRNDYHKSFVPFMDALFCRIAEIAPRTCYLEAGNQCVEDFERRLREQFLTIQRWQTVYYRKHPNWILRASHAEPLLRDFTSMDEAKVIMEIGKIEEYQTLGDMCMGRGLVGLAAYRAGRRFVGTELNPRRLACLLDALAKEGAQVRQVSLIS